MVAKFYQFIMNCWSWIPGSFVICLTALVCFKFGDSVMGLLDRAWRIIGR